MSRRIAKLLGESENEVTKLLSELESKNGFPRHDVRHISQVHQRIRDKITDLNLDPDDTTAQELYHALMTKFGADCQEFESAHNITNYDSDSIVSLASKIIKNSGRLPNLWALKNKAAKEILAAHAPKQVMKYLGYRSVNSMLKREDVSEIFLAAKLLECGTWQKQQGKLISKLDPTAFELRQIKLITLGYEQWSGIGTKSDIVSCDETAAMAVWPSERVGQSPLLSICLLLIEALGQYNSAQLSVKEMFSDDKNMGWWSDMDHLLADLDGGQVSLNLQDVAAGWLSRSDFDDRKLGLGRKNYWQQLVDKYDNKAEVEALFDDTVLRKVRQLKNFNAPQPAFEYDFAEDF